MRPGLGEAIVQLGQHAIKQMPSKPERSGGSLGRHAIISPFIWSSFNRHLLNPGTALGPREAEAALQADGQVAAEPGDNIQAKVVTWSQDLGDELGSVQEIAGGRGFLTKRRAGAKALGHHSGLARRCNRKVIDGAGGEKAKQDSTRSSGGRRRERPAWLPTECVFSCAEHPSV